MQGKSAQIVKEVLWLGISFALTACIGLLVFGKNFLSGTLDIHIHDTYFIVAHLHILLPMFLFLTFLIYFIKEFRNSFKQTLSNWILLITGLILVIVLTFLIKIFSQFFTAAWTEYPPLSALSPAKASGLTLDPVTACITNSLQIIQVVVLLMLSFASYRWGRKAQGNQH